MTTYKVMSRVLTQARESLGLSQSELARRAKVAKGFICELEQGRKRPGEAVLARLAKVLRLDVDELAASAGILGAACETYLLRHPKVVLELRRMARGA